MGELIIGFSTEETLAILTRSALVTLRGKNLIKIDRFKRMKTWRQHMEKFSLEKGAEK